MPAALYLPDLIYWWDGRFQSDVALSVGANGRILGLVPAAEAKGAIPLPGRALLPGLVNAHSHAFQRLIRGRTEHIAAGWPDDNFWSWRERMYQAAGALEPEDLYTASKQAFLEMALAGITTVGEFHYLHHAPDGKRYDNPLELALQVIRAARDVGLRIALLRVAYARSGFNTPPNPRQARFIDRDPDAVLMSLGALEGATRKDSCVTVGLAPHSVRAVPKEWLTAFAAYSGAMHMHVSEQAAEVNACVEEHGRRPVELLQDVGMLKNTFTAVHGIHLELKEIDMLGRAGARVCACPSTEQNLGDGIVPADELVRAGASVCLGTDSHARIDLLGEAAQLEGNLRLLRQRRSVFAPAAERVDALARALFDSATHQGALSLDAGTNGVLSVGAPADFITVDLNHPLLAGATLPTLLPSLLFGADSRVVRDVAVEGNFIVRDGVHPQGEKTRRDFIAVAKKVYA